MEEIVGKYVRTVPFFVSNRIIDWRTYVVLFFGRKGENTTGGRAQDTKFRRWEIVFHYFTSHKKTCKLSTLNLNIFITSHNLLLEMKIGK